MRGNGFDERANPGIERSLQKRSAFGGALRLRRSRLAWRLVLALLAPILAGCALFQPPNLGDLKTQAEAYYANGYQQDLQTVGAAAQDWIRWRAPQVAKPTLVLDIDETSLSNWPEIKANDFGYIVEGPCRLPHGPCGALAWDRTAKAKAIGPTLDLYKVARAMGVSVFFITGRYETERAATVRISAKPVM